MSKNKNNGLKNDALKQVAGGGPPGGYDMNDVNEIQSMLQSLLSSAADTPPGPERRAILEAAQQVSSQLLSVTDAMAQEVKKQSEVIDSIAQSLGR